MKLNGQLLHPTRMTSTDWAVFVDGSARYYNVELNGNGSVRRVSNSQGSPLRLDGPTARAVVGAINAKRKAR